MIPEALKKFDRFQDVVKEMEICRKYGIDYSLEKGDVGKFINRYHPSSLNIRVAETIPRTIDTKTIRLVSQDGYLPPFQAGQYISVAVEVDGIRTSRPYSLSSPPNQTGYYDITVRRVADGLVSNYLLDDLKPGDLLRTSGPEGHFYYNPLFHDQTMVCLAGGSGVTPFMSMIQQIVDCGLERTVYLFLGSPDLGQALFHDQLTAIAARHANIHYVPVIENPPEGYQGRGGLITGDLIQQVVGGVSGKTFYICGPQAMYDFCLPQLEHMGVPARKIRKEAYGPPLRVWEQAGWPYEVKPQDAFEVRVKGGGSFSAPAGATLLTSLEKNGLLVPSLCRSGECSQCRVKLLAGKVFQPAGTPVRRSDAKFGYVHSCVSYPLGNLEILL
ncbi:MAG: FAD-binding oxidoreductase [Pseudomonadota bacterium]